MDSSFSELGLNHCSKNGYWSKIKTNSVDPDEMAYYEPSHLICIVCKIYASVLGLKGNKCASLNSNRRHFEILFANFRQIKS